MNSGHFYVCVWVNWPLNGKRFIIHFNFISNVWIPLWPIYLISIQVKQTVSSLKQRIHFLKTTFEQLNKYIQCAKEIKCHVSFPRQFSVCHASWYERHIISLQNINIQSHKIPVVSLTKMQHYLWRESTFPPDTSERDKAGWVTPADEGGLGCWEGVGGGGGGAIPCLSANTTTTAATHSSLHSWCIFRQKQAYLPAV